MSGRQSSAVERALALIGTPRASGGAHTPYSAAKQEGIALSSIYRALRLRREAVNLRPAHEA